MHTSQMFYKLSQTAKPVTTLVTLPWVGLLVPLGVCSQDGLLGELLVAVLAGVSHDAAMD